MIGPRYLDLVTVTAGVVMLAAVAAWVPASSAAAVDPADALRSQTQEAAWARRPIPRTMPKIRPWMKWSGSKTASRQPTGAIVANPWRARRSHTMASLQRPSMSGRANAAGIGVSRCTQPGVSRGVRQGAALRDEPDRRHAAPVRSRVARPAYRTACTMKSNVPPDTDPIA